jgi:hypothetical protein
LPLALLDVSKTLSQTAGDPLGVIVGVAGSGLTVTVVVADAALRQPLPSVTLTV